MFQVYASLRYPSTWLVCRQGMRQYFSLVLKWLLNCHIIIIIFFELIVYEILSDIYVHETFNLKHQIFNSYYTIFITSVKIKSKECICTAN